MVQNWGFPTRRRALEDERVVDFEWITDEGCHYQMLTINVSGCLVFIYVVYITIYVIVLFPSFN